MDAEIYEYLGDFSAAPPWASRAMDCHKCKVSWTGCWDNFQCPRCGEGELPSADMQVHGYHKGARMKLRDYFFLIMIGLTLSILYLAMVSDASAKEPKIDPSNSVFIDGELTEKVALHVSAELMTMSSKVNHKKPIYLILNTKGGQLTAEKLVETAADLIPNPVYTVSCFAAGTGFNLVQKLGRRYVAKHGIMVVVRPAGALVDSDGTGIVGDLWKKYQAIVEQVKAINDQNAYRMGLDADKYAKLTENQLWLQGQGAIDQGAADELLEQGVCEMESGK
jgi:ATP-dependent protease ClpP protease subunit